MKKMLLMLACLLPGMQMLNAQIVLTKSSYPSAIRGVDSFEVTTYNSAYPSFAAIKDGRWDMSIVTDSTPLFFTEHLPDVAHDFADSNEYLRGGYGFSGNAEYSVTTDGLFEYSVVVKKESYDLSTLTLSTLDSFIIPAQTMPYSSPRVQIAFPTAYNSYWKSAYYSDLNFTLTLTAPGFSYDHEPGYIRRYVTEYDTIIGWGKMMLKYISGAPSDSFKVLQVKTVTETIDSYFLNNAPLSPILLSKLTFKQGATDTSYQQNYYQAMQVSPLVQVTFSDASYSTPVKARTRMNKVSEIDGISNVLPGSLSVFPNPVTGNRLHVDLPLSQTGKWNYRLINAESKQIAKGNSATSFDMTLPDKLTTGIYNLELTDGAYAKQVIPVNIVR